MEKKQSSHFQVEIIETTDLKNIHVSALMVGVFEGPRFPEGFEKLINRYSPIKLEQLIETGEIRGEFKEFVNLHLLPDAPFQRVLFMGLGKESTFNQDVLQSIVAKAVRTFRKNRCPEMAIMPNMFRNIALDDFGKTVVLGATLGLHRTKRLIKEPPAPGKEGKFERIIFLVSPEEDQTKFKRGCFEGEVLGHATNRARDIANAPACFMTPRDLAAHAEMLGKDLGIGVEIFDENELKKRGMGGILAVSAGSEEPPRMIVLRYEGKKGAPRIALVGKGVTFDSGGISLKPPEGMHQMKYDMAGAAAVLETFQAVASLKIPINLVGVIPCAENMVNGKAYKPGDVIKMYNGLHIEITNTDAEGRMLLGDALAFACEQDIDAAFDIATLTGGCVIALGHIATGAMGNNAWLMNRLLEASHKTAEKIWPLPLFPEYGIQMKSMIADKINSGGRPASAITAGLFLQSFVNCPWIHLDIAGTGWIEEDSTLYLHKSYLPKRGATGVGVQTFTQVCEVLALACGSDREKFQTLLKEESTEFKPVA